MFQLHETNAAASAPAPPHEGIAAEAGAVLDGATDAVFCCAPDGTVVTFNPSAEALFGRRREDVLGRPVGEVPGAEGGPELEAILGQVLVGPAVPGLRTHYVRPDGSAVDVSLAASPIRVAGENAGVAFMVRDISSRLTSERQLAQTRGELERHASELARSNADLEQFAYVASHDLSEPLRAITGMLALLREECASELTADAEDYIRRANAAAVRLRTLIDDLLSYSRLGRLPDDAVPVDLAVVFADVVDSITVPDGAEVVLATRLPVVDGSPSELQRLLQNLISNGLKFNESERPRVEVAARSVAGHWTFAVSDNGIGVPDEYDERVFGVFKRLHTRDTYPGTGIGLAICQRIVERHGGKIWLERGRPAGAEVRFTLRGDGDRHV